MNTAPNMMISTRDLKGLAERAARVNERERRERMWRESPEADLRNVKPGKRERRILRPVY